MYVEQQGEKAHSQKITINSECHILLAYENTLFDNDF